MEEADTARDPGSLVLRILRWPFQLVRTLVRVIPQAIDGYFADRCGQHAAGIAYRVLFSLVPLSIILVAIFGIVLRNDSLKNEVIAEIVAAFPLSESGSADVTRQIEKLASPATALGLGSLLVFAWAATGMMAALRAGLEVAMRVPRGRPPVRGKLVDVILIVGAAALVLVVVFLNLAQAVVFGWIDRPLHAVGLDGGLLEQGVRSGAPLLVTVVVVLLLYRFVPARRLRIGDALAGRDHHGALAHRDLARLGPDLRSRQGPQHQRRLRLADVRPRLHLLGLPGSVRAAARRGGRRRMVTPVGGDRRAALPPDPPRRARSLRPPGAARSTAGTGRACRPTRSRRGGTCRAPRSVRRSPWCHA